MGLMLKGLARSTRRHRSRRVRRHGGVLVGEVVREGRAVAPSQPQLSVSLLGRRFVGPDETGHGEVVLHEVTLETRRPVEVGGQCAGHRGLPCSGYADDQDDAAHRIQCGPTGHTAASTSGARQLLNPTGSRASPVSTSNGTSGRPQVRPPMLSPFGQTVRAVGARELGSWPMANEERGGSPMASRRTGVFDPQNVRVGGSRPGTAERRWIPLIYMRRRLPLLRVPAQTDSAGDRPALIPRDAQARPASEEWLPLVRQVDAVPVHSGTRRRRAGKPPSRGLSAGIWTSATAVPHN
jgi:hypothetical protein